MKKNYKLITFDEIDSFLKHKNWIASPENNVSNTKRYKKKNERIKIQVNMGEFLYLLSIKKTLNSLAQIENLSINELIKLIINYKALMDISHTKALLVEAVGIIGSAKLLRKIIIERNDELSQVNYNVIFRIAFERRQTDILLLLIDGNYVDIYTQIELLIDYANKLRWQKADVTNSKLIILLIKSVLSSIAIDDMLCLKQRKNK